MDDSTTNSPSAMNIETPDIQPEPQLPAKNEPIEPLEHVEPVEPAGPAGPVEPLKPVVKGPKVEKSKLPIPRTSAQSRNGMNGPLYMQASHNRIIIRRVRRKDGGIMRGLARWLLDNQTGFSFNIIALIFLAHTLLPKARPYTLKFFTLSYFNPDSGLYRIGWDDFYFITFCIVLFTGLRAFFMEHVLAPLAKHWGVTKKGDVTRFSEQAWLLVYYSAFWPLGMVLVIHIEERRKDHWQMLTHHFITVTLIAACYAYHHTRVGNLILVLMDVVDLFLPLAKCLKYTGFTTLCDAIFGVFMLSWFVARHVLYLVVCHSIWKQSPEIIADGCWHGPADNLTGPFPAPDRWGHLLEPIKEPATGTVCFTESVLNVFLFCLLFLQAITIFWFFMIIQVAIRVLKGAGAEDIRSDDEGEEEEDCYEYEEAQPYEEEVGVEAIDLKNWERRTGVKRTATSSGVSLPGHSDRKELLGRIGCEKQVD
ncbi:Sphingosine N-acyltransferase lag1 [Diatrype stigma]|uniref:Sphingosine N-acyltransferase lag1 n=1 Tax=Diatrype stigma TaxID=117547 RepID=A0AAN9YTF7_9PEZI